MGFLDLEKIQEKTNYMVNIQILLTFIYNALAIYGKREVSTFFLYNFKCSLYLSELHKRANKSESEVPVHLVNVRNSNCSPKSMHIT